MGQFNYRNLAKLDIPLPEFAIHLLPGQCSGEAVPHSRLCAKAPDASEKLVSAWRFQPRAEGTCGRATRGVSTGWPSLKGLSLVPCSTAWAS